MRRAHAAGNKPIASADFGSFLLRFYDANAEFEAIEEGAATSRSGRDCRLFRGWPDVWDDFRWELEEVIDAGDQE